ncbi:MAG: hypothetical protein Tp138OMZ00d2C19078221_27 [Prokaryotic dsDNA virus sp.]|mgnify:CR=1 FL=1|jgi:hypothetical protein|nr:hypothetical protein [Pseudomonadales bacterium]QDP67455.1 MAG: hypothetical protein Tp138OMZ00d2C19078221_27 [Prokaryotic dsDNA virus sp.]
MLATILMLASMVLATLFYAATKRAEAYNADAKLLELEIDADDELIMRLADALSAHPGHGPLIAEAHRHLSRP